MSEKFSEEERFKAAQKLIGNVNDGVSEETNRLRDLVIIEWRGAVFAYGIICGIVGMSVSRLLALSSSSFAIPLFLLFLGLCWILSKNIVIGLCGAAGSVAIRYALDKLEYAKANATEETISALLGKQEERKCENSSVP